MPTDCITYQESGFFSKIIVDYLNETPNLKSFYNHYPNLENFGKQMEEKSFNYDFDIRKILFLELENQNRKILSDVLLKR